ncbi:c-type cytochrome [Novosphingobium sediminicola]|uniref:Cytochrome c n=1 Tax=Novosphingobium sediminicola TaxID=563162 RepID=A0A7W6CMF2_9SPHN|nr:cytochrome c family protein [Novosphingobium sediminicola]MBB3954157.1 cytochrome c [Novosphingobium sediminicola]
MKVSRFMGLTVMAMGLATAGAAQAQGADPAVRGKLLFLQCGACHAVVPGAPAKVGPNLSGVFGRKAGAAAGFKYSPALTKAGLTWNEGNLDKWLAAPAKLAPGTIMLFPGLPKPEDRKAVIAYIKTLK